MHYFSNSVEAYELPPKMKQLKYTYCIQALAEFTIGLHFIYHHCDVNLPDKHIAKDNTHL